jgi:hypothetical protein
MSIYGKTLGGQTSLTVYEIFGDENNVIDQDYEYATKKYVDDTMAGGSASLSTLTDVDVTGATVNNLLAYNGTDWVDTSNITVNNITFGGLLQGVSPTEINYSDGLTAPIQGQINDRELASNKNIPNGYCGLDASGKIEASRIPAIALTEVHVVADNAARDALTVEEGDIAIVTSTNLSWVYGGSSWIELTASGEVTSVNGQAGSVSLAINDINDVNISTPTNGDLIVYNAGEWVNSKLDSNFTLVDDVDNTKRFKIQLDQLDTGTTHLLTIPNATSTTMVGTDLIQTLNNKSINANTNTITNLNLNASNFEDVEITTPLNNQLLRYNSGTSKWVNSSDSSITASSTDTFSNKSIDANTNTITNLNLNASHFEDVEITTPLNNQLLRYNSGSSKWVNSSDSSITASSTDTLSNKSINANTNTITNLNLDASHFEDINLSSLSNNQILRYNNATSDWENTSDYINSTSTAIGSMSLPTTSTEIIGNTENQTITNKVMSFGTGNLRLNAPVTTTNQYLIATSEITSTRTVTLPLITVDDEFALLSANQTISGIKAFLNTTFRLRNPINLNSYIFQTSGITADRTVTVPLLTNNDTMPFLGISQSWTGVNSFAATGIAIRNPASSFSFTISAPAITGNRTLNLPLLSGTDTITTNAFASTFTGIKTFNTGTLQFRNPGNSSSYIILGSAITATRTITVPLLTGNDIFVMEAHPQNITGAKQFFNTALRVFDTGGSSIYTLAGGTLASGSQTLNLPSINAGDTLVSRNSTDTITNKNLSSGNSISDTTNFYDDALSTRIAQIRLNSSLPVGTTIFELPSTGHVSGDQILTTNSTHALITNKVFSDACTFASSGNASKKLRFDLTTFPTTTTFVQSIQATDGWVITDNCDSNGGRSIGDPNRYNTIRLTQGVDIERATTLGSTYEPYMTFRNSNDTSSWLLSIQTTVVGTARLGFRYGGAGTRGYFSSSGPDTQVNMTIEHNVVIQDENVLRNAELYSGLAVVRVDRQINTFLSSDPTKEYTGKAGIFVNDALPICKLSTQRNQKGVFGILVKKSSNEFFSGAVGMELDEKVQSKRCVVASGGEGACWISNIYGNIELGDFISTSEHPGLCARQMAKNDVNEEDVDNYRSWSIAKAGFSCEFDLLSNDYVCVEYEYQGQTFKKSLIPVSFLT